MLHDILVHRHGPGIKGHTVGRCKQLPISDVTY